MGNPIEAARSHVLPGGRLTDEAHRRLAATERALRPHACPYCPARYATADERDDHQRSHGE